MVGALNGVSANRLVLAPEGDRNGELTLSAAKVRRVDISRGRRSRTGRGACFGLLGGLVGGYVALLQICKDGCVGATVLVVLPIWRRSGRRRHRGRDREPDPHRTVATGLMAVSWMKVLGHR